MIVLNLGMGFWAFELLTPDNPVEETQCACCTSDEEEELEPMMVMGSCCDLYGHVLGFTQTEHSYGTNCYVTKYQICIRSDCSYRYNISTTYCGNHPYGQHEGPCSPGWINALFCGGCGAPLKYTMSCTILGCTKATVIAINCSAGCY